MRPTHTDFRSPKIRSGEYVYPLTTCHGNKIFNALQPVPAQLAVKPALNGDILAEQHPKATMVIPKERRHTSFGNERRFQEVKVSHPALDCEAAAKTDR